ncbi:MAG: DedA family protein [Chloroflexota bacterium]|nr:DedA family protein [Chloroflexota bacterium]
MQFLVDTILHADPLLIYILVAVLLLLESTGAPIVNNTLLLFTGALASLGKLDIWVLIAFAIVGSSCGACIAYFIGQRGGRRILLRVTSFFRVDEKKVRIAEQWFQKSGLWMIFFSRMTPYIRPFACFPAGISQMNFPRFFITALTGSILWCVTIIHLGAALGPHWRFALHLVQEYTLFTLSILVVLVLIYILLKRYLRLRLQTNLAQMVETDDQENRDHDMVKL